MLSVGHDRGTNGEIRGTDRGSAISCFLPPPPHVYRKITGDANDDDDDDDDDDEGARPSVTRCRTLSSPSPSN